MKYLGVLLLFVGCSKPPTWTKEQLLSMGLKKDSSVSLVLPSKITAGVTCAEYGEGCVGAHIVSVQKIEMIAVEFSTSEEAFASAKRLRAFYSRNWIFDDVTGEPLLERFVRDALEAKKFDESPLKEGEPVKPE